MLEDQQQPLTHENANAKGSSTTKGINLFVTKKQLKITSQLLHVYDETDRLLTDSQTISL